jgi:hypothetical protein
MKKYRRFEVELFAMRVADDEAAKQTPIYHFCDVHVMIVERPCADAILFHIKHITPFFAGANGVAPIAVVAVGTERPRAIRVNAIMQAMQVKTMRLFVGI